MSLQELRKLTRREISQLIDAMVSRKQNYPDNAANVNLEQTDEIKARIRKALGKRFGKELVGDGKE